MKPPSSYFPRWLAHPITQLILVGLLTWLAYLDLTLTYPLKALVEKYPLTDFGRANDWSQSSLFDFLFSIFGAFVLYLLAWRVLVAFTASALLPYAATFWIWNYRAWQILQVNMMFVSAKSKHWRVWLF